MASVKVFFTFVTFFAVAFSSNIFFSIPYSVVLNLYQAYRFCPGNNTNLTIYNKLVKDATHCYGGTFSNNSHHSICYSFELNVQRCSQPLVDYFVDCLPEETKDVPPAIVKAAVSVVETFCTSSGEILLEAVNMCIYEYLDQRNITIKEECKKRTFQPKLDKFDVELPTKSEICQVGREIGDCWQDYVNLNCQNSKTKELFLKFYNAALSPCEK